MGNRYWRLLLRDLYQLFSYGLYIEREVGGSFCIYLFFVGRN